MSWLTAFVCPSHTDKEVEEEEVKEVVEEVAEVEEVVEEVKEEEKEEEVVEVVKEVVEEEEEKVVSLILLSLPLLIVAVSFQTDSPQLLTTTSLVGAEF